MVIVKLGGSLYQSPELSVWLDRLTELSNQQKILIVPGGGPFADQVRDAQSHFACSDSVAHHMALLAMSQFGLLLSDVCPTIQPFYYHTAQQQPDSPLSVWLPDKTLLAESNLPQNWDLTSDSLALWLAQQLRAVKLSLIKHRPNNQPCSNNIDTLIKTGVLDRYFTKQYRTSPISTEVIAVTHSQSFTLALPAEPLHHD